MIHLFMQSISHEIVESLKCEWIIVMKLGNNNVISKDTVIS